MASILLPLTLLAGTYAAYRILRLSGSSWIELPALSVGLGIVYMIALTPLSLIAVAIVIGLAIAMGVLVELWYRVGGREGLLPLVHSAPTRLDRRQTIAVALLLLLTAFYRLTDLGYSEFQGDEARAMSMATALGETRDLDLLLGHKKGPVEILLPTDAVRSGDRSEGTARLPFALANLAGVLAVLALGMRLRGFWVGWLAALVLALDGYHIAFARIVQYQSVVFLASTLAVWAAWRFYSRDRIGDRYLLLSGLFLGLGMLAHYEAVFAAIPVAWLALARAREERWSVATTIRRLAPGAVAASAITAAFYLPYIRHPGFADTASYILDRRIGGGQYNKLGDYFARASFYNASTYVLFLATVLTAFVAVRLRGALGKRGEWLVAIWGLALAAVVLVPDRLTLGDESRSLAILVFLPVFGVLVWDGLRRWWTERDSPGSNQTSASDSSRETSRSETSRSENVAWLALLLWFAGPFFVAAFLSVKPHTHFYTMMPPYALLVAWALQLGWHGLARRIGRPNSQRMAVALGAVLVGAFGWHQYVVFIRHTPEYKRVFPEGRMAGYWTPFGDELPRGGYFGFPYRAGWNTVNQWLKDGTLDASATFDSNEEPLITDWYAAGIKREATNPRYYFVAWRPQDEEEIPSTEELERTHHLKATVTVAGQPKLWVYDREPVTGDVVTGEEWVR